MNLLLGALTIGLLLALLALGVLVTYRVFGQLDITADGSFGLGGAVAASLLVAGMPPVPATLFAVLAGTLAGTLTGVMHTRFGVHTLLAGILTTTALYSGNLYIMGGGDVALASEDSLFSIAERGWVALQGSPDGLVVFGTAVSAGNWAALALMLLLVSLAALGLDHFFGTNLGLAMRATGNNPQMARALGVAVGPMIVLGLALSNGLIALSGALFAQYQGFANVQMGFGMVVTGLASVIVGETLVGKGSVRRRIAGAVAGAVLFRLLVAGALRAGLDPNALKLISALFVFAALVLPRLVQRWAGRRLSLGEAGRG